ncbi:peptide deformylase [bacterium]|nr:peptide deformylase [bacterium]MBU1994859.1 peptide deformylase [bacterium]
MVQEITRYPSPPSVQYGTDVRVFDENLFSLIEDLKDTLKQNKLDGLAAFQIGSYFNVVVVKKEDGSFLELINPRMISPKGKITTVEKTAYFPGLSAEISRYQDISVIYQDRDAKQCSIKASGDFAVLIQRKLDYTFGANFLSKLSKEERKKFEKKLEFGTDIAISESCPTRFKRDYFSKASNIFTIAMLVLLLSSLFVSDTQILSGMWKYQIYLFLSVLVLNIGYFFYGLYEGKKYSSCTSCQVGNIIGTIVIAMIKLIVVMLVSYFVIHPR